MTSNDKPDTADLPADLPDTLPRRPTGDVGQGARQTLFVELDPAALARAVIERRGY